MHEQRSDYVGNSVSPNIKSEEIWQDIPGCEGEYQVSTYGRVKSLTRYVKNGQKPTIRYRLTEDRILQPGRFTESGHVSVVLRKGSMGRPVHQLVMETFMGKTPDGMEIRHINGEPTDNRLVNLEFGTRTENIRDVYRQGGKMHAFTIKDVICIRQKIKSGYTNSELAREYGVGRGTIWRIKTRRSFRWLTEDFLNACTEEALI